MTTWYHRVAYAALTLGLVFGAGHDAVAAPDDDPPVNVQIIGGHDATETYSFHAAMSNGCGGSLVAPQWIVTATHCGSASSARIGSIYRSSGGEVRSIDRRVDRAGTDLTLMHLSQASTLTPVRMASANPAAGTPVRLIGYGCTSWPSCSQPSTLQEIDLTILDSSRCYAGGGTSTDICVSGDRTHSACHGDSGGPALVGTRGNWTLVGETHGPGDNNGECATTTLYTGIAANLAWINQQTGGTPPGGAKFENTNNVDIPDVGPAVTSPVTVSGQTGNAPAALKVNVDIKHTYRGDLVIDLVAPDGSVYRLKGSSGSDSADNVLATYTVDASTETANGTWNLRVQDVAAQDVGYIDAWSLQF
ncbi:trypsin-like serine protease [Saccharothrix variisporea]|uniref:Proprotein convertase P-domain-containing protein n=1 Tax=Saccharothrix variisporea TaxID=543527 RepID=A0A495X3R9_9PSEU|nr:trypsin-like serine protease [Saccharothrix variisporea]RKT67814.1 proprotein convertase P-domain-containing protein [Saccharothrix variisporea]